MKKSSFSIIHIFYPMNKIIYLLLPLFIISCEEIPDSEITTPVDSYQVTKISAPTEFVYSQSNRQFTAIVEFTSTTGVQNVFFNIFSPSGKQINTESVRMKDDGDLDVGDIVANDKKYSAIFQFPDVNSNGNYKLYFYIEDNEKTVNAAVHFIKLSNFENATPVISDLVMPDTVSVGVNFTFTLKASDSNGMDDLDRVFFSFIGATGEVIGLMHDDGNSNFGDQKSGDGIFSYKSFFTEEARGQERTFTFQARDRGNAISNTITHKLYVK